jgi:hypothetical protein
LLLERLFGATAALLEHLFGATASLLEHLRGLRLTPIAFALQSLQKNVVRIAFHMIIIKRGRLRSVRS